MERLGGGLRNPSSYVDMTNPFPRLDGRLRNRLAESPNHIAIGFHIGQLGGRS
jgi:hypothetical protein